MSARRALATQLRWLRLEADLTSTQLSEAAGISQGKISKVERGNQSIRVDHVDAWIRACSAPEAVRADLLELAETALTEATSWRREHRAGLAVKQHKVADLQAEAVRIREFNPATVPGLLQTSGYARALLDYADVSAQRDIDAAVEARLARQTILDDTGKSIEFVVTQSALTWHYDAEQLARIAEILDGGRVRLGIVPADADVPPPVNPFAIYDLPDDSRVVSETFVAEVDHDDPRDVATFVGIFEAFAAAGRFGADAARLLT